MEEKFINGEKVYIFDELTSTMDLADKLITQNKTDVVVAKKQTKGRGRYGRKWYSEEGGLYFSFIEKNGRNDFLSEIVSFSIVKTLQEYRINCKIKFPNDIIYRNKKIAGILIEKKGEIYIIGIGINVNNYINEEINGISMKEILKREIKIEKVLEKFLIIYKLNREEFQKNKRFYLKKWSDFLQK